MKGTVTKRLNRAGRARWAYAFDVGKDEVGNRRQITKSGFLTQREAQDALRKAMAENQETPPTTKEKAMPTFAAFAERWFADGNPREWSPKTLERQKELAQIQSGSSAMSRSIS